MKDDDFFKLLPLSDEEQKLIDAYIETRCPVDQLPYSAHFDELVKRLGDPDTREAKYHVFQRLLTLRKRGRLPTLGRTRADTY